MTMFALGLGLLAPAHAADTTTTADRDEEEDDERLLAIGVHAGPRVPLDALGLAILPRAEVGILVPNLNEHLLVFATVGWTAPPASGDAPDPRVPGGSYAWDLTLNELQIGLGLTLDLAPRGWHVHPELSVAPQLFLLRTRADGRAEGQPFGPYREEWPEWGGMAAVGVGLDVGPGRILVRVEGELAPLDGLITGAFTSVGIAPTLGYRFMF